MNEGYFLCSKEQLEERMKQIKKRIPSTIFDAFQYWQFG
jgi:hypothetical protein